MDLGPTHGTSHFIYSSLSNADNLSQGDLWGLLLVYSYIGAVVLIASKSAYLKRTKMHRKFIHIMIGNIVFFWWVFDHAWAMALLAAAPFIFFCYLLSKEGSRTDEPRSKMEKELKGSISGRGLDQWAQARSGLLCHILDDAGVRFLRQPDDSFHRHSLHGLRRWHGRTYRQEVWEAKDTRRQDIGGEPSPFSYSP